MMTLSFVLLPLRSSSSSSSPFDQSLFEEQPKMTLIIFEASVLKSFRIFPMTSFLSFCGKTACAGKREFQVLYSTFYIHYIRDDDERQ